MTTTTPEIDEQLLNLYFLRDVVIPHMKKPTTLVDFEVYAHHARCGTYRCLYGWYCFLRHHDDEYAPMSHMFFDFPHDIPAVSLFGGENWGDLERRESILNNYIKAIEKSIKPGEDNDHK